MCAHFQDVTGISSNRRFCHLYIRLESLDLKYQPHKDNIDQTRSNSQKCGFHRTYFKSIWRQPTRQERAERVPFTNQALNVVLSPVVKGSPPATWPAGPPWSRPPGWPVWGWRVPGRGGQAGLTPSGTGWCRSPPGPKRKLKTTTKYPCNSMLVSEVRSKVWHNSVWGATIRGLQCKAFRHCAKASFRKVMVLYRLFLTFQKHSSK